MTVMTAMASRLSLADLQFSLEDRDENTDLFIALQLRVELCRQRPPCVEVHPPHPHLARDRNVITGEETVFDKRKKMQVNERNFLGAAGTTGVGT